VRPRHHSAKVPPCVRRFEEEAMPFMPFGFDDFDSAFQLLDDFRREVDRLYEGRTPQRRGGQAWSGLRLEDAGNAYVLTADVPGVKEGDIGLMLENQTLTLTVERKAEAPQGYNVHRQERAPWRLARSFALPTRVDAEKVRASLAHGVLTVTVEKSPESQPRKISVQRA
jgi:HSP20 family protein